jgi:hypothetical protein
MARAAGSKWREQPRAGRDRRRGRKELLREENSVVNKIDSNSKPNDSSKWWTKFCRRREVDAVPRRQSAEVIGERLECVEISTDFPTYIDCARTAYIQE